MVIRTVFQHKISVAVNFHAPIECGVIDREIVTKEVSGCSNYNQYHSLTSEGTVVRSFSYANVVI